MNFYSVECSFEETNPVMCGWKNVKGGKDDDFDWSLGQGATSSINTGPAKDHTYNDDKGRAGISFAYLHSFSVTGFF